MMLKSYLSRNFPAGKKNLVSAFLDVLLAGATWRPTGLFFPKLRCSMQSFSTSSTLTGTTCPQPGGWSHPYYMHWSHPTGAPTSIMFSTHWRQRPTDRAIFPTRLSSWTRFQASSTWQWPIGMTRTLPRLMASLSLGELLQWVDDTWKNTFRSLDERISTWLQRKAARG